MELLAFNPGKTEEIIQLYIKAFSDSEGQDEGEIIGTLSSELIKHTDPQDLYGFVATENKQIIGSIFFSRLTFQNGVHAFMLSPVAIKTECQGKHAGQKLINFGISRLKENGVELLFTYGDPAYYSKVGFQKISEDIAKAPFKLSHPE